MTIAATTPALAREAGPTAVMRSMRAELLRLRKWPVTWVIIGVWSVLNLFFAYGLPYLTYRNALSDGDDRLARVLLGSMSLEQLPPTLVQGMPMFGGGIVLILAALATGSGYGWSTWKTVFTQGPRRLAVFTGTLAALGAIVVGVVILTVALDTVASLVVLSVESQELTGPAPADLAQAVGAGLLMMLTFAMGGALLGVLARSPALSVGLGLIWILVIENLLRGAAALLGPLETLTDVLPGTAAGSLAGALGSTPAGDTNGTPGVLTTLSGTSAALLLGAYAVLFVVVMSAVVARRDT